MGQKVRQSVAALVWLVSLLGLACVSGTKSEDDFVLDQATALEHAIRYASEQLYSRKIGNILIESRKAGYRIRLIELPEPDHQIHTISMDVDGMTGTARNLRRAPSEASPYDSASTLLADTLVDAIEAYRAALRAVAGFEHFDDKGKLSVELSEGDYVVTFPLASEQQAGARTADYAYKIWIDGVTAKIIKILTSS